MTDLWFFQKKSLGKWYPQTSVMDPEAPRAGESRAGPIIRNKVKLPECLHGMTLEQLTEIQREFGKG